MTKDESLEFQWRKFELMRFRFRISNDASIDITTRHAALWWLDKEIDEMQEALTV